MDPLERINDTIRVMNEAIAADAAAEKVADERRAEAARRGELGPEWRRLQARIDLEETTLEEVFDGTDTSPEAEALRAQASVRLRATVEQLEAEAAVDPTAPNPRADAAEALSELQRQIEQLTRRMGDLR
jgi:hypothetical protein